VTKFVTLISVCDSGSCDMGHAVKLMSALSPGISLPLQGTLIICKFV